MSFWVKSWEQFLTKWQQLLRSCDTFAITWQTKAILNNRSFPVSRAKARMSARERRKGGNFLRKPFSTLIGSHLATLLVTNNEFFIIRDLSAKMREISLNFRQIFGLNDNKLSEIWVEIKAWLLCATTAATKTSFGSRATAPTSSSRDLERGREGAR